MSAKLSTTTTSISCETNPVPTARFRTAAKLISNDFFLIGLLITINLLCFYRSLHGYFLADDFVHIPYLDKVFHGHPELLLNNFYSNWTQASGTQFYRPLISITLALDYLIWGVNAFGYHLTNIVWQVAATIFLFLFAKRLLSGTEIRVSKRGEEPCAANEVDARRRQGTQPTERSQEKFSAAEAHLASFFAAALFAASPLHCEVVSWVIGRVDGVCTALYLGSMWLWLKGIQEGSKGLTALSLVCFMLSLMSKEMAVTLPAALTLCCLTSGRPPEMEVRDEKSLKLQPISVEVSKQLLGPKAPNWRQCVLHAWQRTWPFWALLTGYILVRTFALGTVTGGYSGSIGESLSTSFVKRFFQDGAFYKILFPLNGALYHPGNRTELFLMVLYIAIGLIFSLRVLLKLVDVKLARILAFVTGWFVLSMIPTYQVFNLSDTLFGSRLIYLGTAPLSLLIALLAFPLTMPKSDRSAIKDDVVVPYELRSGSVHKWGTINWLKFIAASVLCVLVLSFSIVAYKNNLSWVKAGNQVRALRASIESAIESLPPERKLVVLNVPQRFEGAHLIYNAAMLTVLLSPPLSKKELYRRVVTFEPVNYGEPDLLIASRLRELIKQPDSYALYEWDGAKHKLLPLDLVPSQAELILPAKLSLAGLSGRRSVLSPIFNLPSTATDFLDIYLSSMRDNQDDKIVKTQPVLVVSWAGGRELTPTGAERRLAVPLNADGRMHRYRLYVSEHKCWVMSERINRLRLDLVPGGFKHHLSRVELLNGSKEIPRLAIDPAFMVEALNGVSYMLNGESAFIYDASLLPQVKRVAIELSRPNSWFEHYSGTYRDQKLSSRAMRRWVLEKSSGKFTLKSRVFPDPGYYQVRIAALAQGGQVVGYVSDPVNLQVTQN